MRPRRCEPLNSRREEHAPGRGAYCRKEPSGPRRGGRCGGAAPGGAFRQMARLPLVPLRVAVGRAQPGRQRSGDRRRPERTAVTGKPDTRSVATGHGHGLAPLAKPALTEPFSQAFRNVAIRHASPCPGFGIYRVRLFPLFNVSGAFRPNRDQQRCPLGRIVTEIVSKAGHGQGHFASRSSSEMTGLK